MQFVLLADSLAETLSAYTHEDCGGVFVDISGLRVAQIAHDGRTTSAEAAAEQDGDSLLHADLVSLCAGMA